jgi:hypothetical protein
MIGNYRISCWLLTAMSISSPIAAVGQTGVSASQQSVPGCATNRPVAPISPNAEQVAGTIGVLPLVQRMRSLASACSAGGVISVEELTLRQQIG